MYEGECERCAPRGARRVALVCSLAARVPPLVAAAAGGALHVSCSAQTCVQALAKVHDLMARQRLQDL